MSCTYVLVTAARNEQELIERTIKSVLRQTVLPTRWVIVSDCSTDHTDEIVETYAKKYSFITLIRVDKEGARNFGSKANAVIQGLGYINEAYDFLGNVDADVELEPKYFEILLKKFEQDNRLGIAGGEQCDFYRGKYHKVVNDENIVGGAAQFFRRECYERIGGYVPIDAGGIDFVPVIKAKMLGWKVRTFSELKVFHNRREGSSIDKILVARFKEGVRDYQLGHHVLFQMAKCIRRSVEWPYILSSISRILGYFHSLVFMNNNDRPVSDEFIRFLRKEQLKRIQRALLMPKLK